METTGQSRRLIFEQLRKRNVGLTTLLYPASWVKCVKYIELHCYYVNFVLSYIVGLVRTLYSCISKWSICYSYAYACV